MIDHDISSEPPWEELVAMFDVVEVLRVTGSWLFTEAPLRFSRLQHVELLWIREEKLLASVASALLQCDTLKTVTLTAFPAGRLSTAPVWQSIVKLPVVSITLLGELNSLPCLSALPLTRLANIRCHPSLMKDASKLLPRLTDLQFAEGLTDDAIGQLSGLQLTRFANGEAIEQHVTGRSFPVLRSFPLRDLTL